MRNFIKCFCFVICAFIFFSFSLLKYNGPIDLILSNLDAYATNYSPNKIYLQTDRSIYALEDTVWFKAYTLDAIHHFPTANPKVIYVDVVNNNGKKVLGKKLYTENLGVAADFFIEREWEPGSYKLRAYTRFMLNDDQAYIFNKEIEIVDINQVAGKIGLSSNTKNSEKGTSSTSALEIKFFPESGDLVAGINSRVAIRIENYSPDLGAVSGVIEDESGNYVELFKVFERGYGLVAFTPEAGKKYVAKLDNDPLIYPLPEVKAEGYNIRTISNSHKVFITISSNGKSALSGGDILIHSRGQLVHHEKLDIIADDSYGLKLNTKEMPSGVTQITFFDKEGIPRAERLFFVNNDLSQSVIKTDKSIYGKREKVDLSLSVINSDLKSFDCSVSVFDKSGLKGARPSDNIKSWMLLNSDLRGAINDPAFYFEKTGDRKRTFLLDLLMMTHGWRRFTWEDMRQEGVFKDLKYKRELGLYVQGYTSRLINTGKPVKTKVLLNVLNDGIRQEELVTGEDGRFAFGPLVMEDSVVAIIQARKYNEKKEKGVLDGNRKLKINIDAPQYLNLKQPTVAESDAFDYTAYKTFINTNKKSQALKDQSHHMEVTLSEIVLTAKRKTKEDEMDKIVSEKSLYTIPSDRVVVEDRDRGNNLSVFDMLRTVPGVIVGGSFPNQSVTIRGISSILLTSTPLFLLDGVAVGGDFIGQISTNEIRFIDVLKDAANTAIYGSRGANGVVAIYTGRDPESKVTRRSPGIIDIIIKGFDKHREFYAPDYAKNVSSLSGPDVRATLYWNPYVLLSEGKENTMSFFTSDNTGDYVVITEGLSEDGEPIFGTYEFRVE